MSDAETLADIRTAVATMNTKMDMLIQRFDPALSDHESRLRKLEARVWVAAGAAVAGGGTLGSVVGAILGGGRW